jgi:hypothetical protein
MYNHENQDVFLFTLVSPNFSKHQACVDLDQLSDSW